MQLTKKDDNLRSGIKKRHTLRNIQFEIRMLFLKSSQRSCK